MPRRHDSFPSSWSAELVGAVPDRPAPGKENLTQRMARPTPRAEVPVQREVDPDAAAGQRQRTEHDLAAALGFLGGPAASIEESLVQMQADAVTGLGDDAIRAHAAAGVADGGTTLPHLGAIQRAFGPHDVTGVRAHVGGAASDAAHAIGAHAYATGTDVAFAHQPDLFLAAHEAAHVVQQRRGVQLSSAVGHSGDRYERHADDVAAAVVRGDSAADLLGAVGGGGGATAVQRGGEDGGSEMEASKTGGGNNAHLEKNAPDGATELPWTKRGWNGKAILTRLGQYDRDDSTVEDANRCVPTVGLMSHVLQGPEATAVYLDRMVADAQSVSKRPVAAQLGPMFSLGMIALAIRNKCATYATLSDAQELLHKLMLEPDHGTDSSVPFMAPSGESIARQPIDVWCNSAEEAMTYIKQLGDGERLTLVALKVTLGSKTEAEMDDYAATRPARADVTRKRDGFQEHQLMAFNDGGTHYVYDPELQATGKHLWKASSAKALKEYFTAELSFGQVDYIQIVDKYVKAAK